MSEVNTCKREETRAIQERTLHAKDRKQQACSRSKQQCMQKRGCAKGKTWAKNEREVTTCVLGKSKQR